MSRPNSEKTIPQAQPPLELHACMGLNACKGHGWTGKNDCAGTGDCATSRHVCHTLNDCRGQGGCGLYGSSEEVCNPGQNDCAMQGSCGTPILASRFITQGPNKGQSVWQLARKLFEGRMAKANRSVGAPPNGPDGQSMIYGPTTEFAKTIGAGSSCGYSGDRYCSYAFGKEEREVDKIENRNRFVKNSAADIEQALDNCKCDS